MSFLPRRYYVALVVLILLLYSLTFIFASPDESATPQTKPQSFIYKPYTLPEELANPNTTSAPHAEPAPLLPKANATFVALARNSDLKGIEQSIQHVQRRFNNKHHYPWVFLNEEPFSETFKAHVVALTEGSEVEFGLIPGEHWYQPDWIDEERATQERQKMVSKGIIYADSVPYRNMCRFNSGFFFRHPLLQKYKYYWRVEPDIEYFCDILYDPFIYMEQHDKVYGFTISFTEWEPTIPTLWGSVKEFISEHPEYVSEQNAMSYLSDNNGDHYNLCHFWSNFEIANMDFWRSEPYMKFFDFLESKGGFYYERWGDAPVHSIAAALFLRKNQLHFFRDIGYNHPPFFHCPPEEAQFALDGELDGMTNGETRRKTDSCECSTFENIDYRPQSCIRRYESLFA